MGSQMVVPWPGVKCFDETNWRRATTRPGSRRHPGRALKTP